MKMHYTIGAVMAALFLGALPHVGAAPVVGNPNELGFPAPGQTSDQESTKKQRDPGKVHQPDSDAQVTLGGAQTFVEGRISRIEGDYYFVRKADSREETRLLVNRDTNLDCAAAPSRPEAASAQAMTSDQLTEREQAPQASEKQLQQGQRADETARGSGFRVGQCSFQAGDRVKAEVDDNGKVTTLKYMAGPPPSAPRATGPSAGTGELAIPGRQEKPAELDITGSHGYPPKEYSVVPLRAGPLESVQDDMFIQRPVFDLHGQQVGTLENLLMDKATGQIEYAVILVAHTEHHLHPMPWSAIERKDDGQGHITMVVDTDKYKIHPDLMVTDWADRSPELKQIIKDIKILRDREKKVAKDRPVDPRGVGPMGEEKTGGSGPSGTAGPPPGPAPGYEQEKDRG